MAEENKELSIKEKYGADKFLPADDVTNNPRLHEYLWKLSCTLAQSEIIPQKFRGKAPSIYSVLEATRNLKGVSVTQAMSHMHDIKGNIGMDAQLMNALLTNSGLIKGVVDYEETIDGESTFNGQKMANHVCVAAVHCFDGKIRKSTPVDYRMAIAEGWWGKSGSKWQTMPKNMLRKRAVSFLVRDYFPGITMGIPIIDELQDSTIPEMNTGPTLKNNLTPDIQVNDEIDKMQKPEIIAELKNEFGYPANQSTEIDLLRGILRDCRANRITPIEDAVDAEFSEPEKPEDNEGDNFRVQM